MPTRLLLVMFATLLSGISPIVNNRAIKIHGPAVHVVIANVFLLVLSLAWLIFFHRQDVFFISQKSFSLAAAAGCIVFFAIAALFSAYQAAPQELTVITITTSFSFVILAFLNHLLGSKLAFHQWIGAVIALLGIILVRWKI